MKTDKEILEIIYNNCKLENFSTNTILKNIIFPLQDYLLDFNMGNDKVVLEFKDYNYMIKIPYKYNITEKSNKKIYHHSLDTENGLIDFFNNLDLKSGVLFKKNILISNEKFPIYKQEKINILIKQAEIKQLTLEEKQNILNILNLIEFNDFQYEILNRSYLLPWLYDIYVFYGFAIIIEFLTFLKGIKSIDLNYTNIGYDQYGKPAIIDYIIKI